MSARMIELADRIVEAISGCTPLQRQALRRAVMLGPSTPEQVEMWERVSPALEADAGESDASLEELRAAADVMPFDAWAAFNDLIFELHRGGAFDDKLIRLEGGGIKFQFAQAARWEQFLSFFEEESSHIGKAGPFVLDAGCWQGTLACELLQRHCAVGAADISAGMEPIVRERVSWLRAGDAARFLGFRAGPLHESLTRPGCEAIFDIVCCQETLEHVPTRYLQATCDALLSATKRSVLVTVPGWDDGWSLHLRVFTVEDFLRLFQAEQNEVTILQPPGGEVYTTVRVRKR